MKKLLIIFVLLASFNCAYADHYDENQERTHDLLEELNSTMIELKKELALLNQTSILMKDYMKNISRAVGDYHQDYD